jgi:hypothetical protein
MPQFPQANTGVYRGTQFWRSGSISGRATSRLHVRRSGFEVLVCFVPPLGQAIGRAGLVLGGGLYVQPLKHGVGTYIGTQSQNPTPGVFDHAPSLEHNLLHHRLHAPALGRKAQWRVFANERNLTIQAQDVDRHRSQGADQEVGIKLAAGQTRQIHVGLELRMELLVPGVVSILINDVLHRELLGQRRRPALPLIVGQTYSAVGCMNQATTTLTRAGGTSVAIHFMDGYSTSSLLKPIRHR